MVNVSCRILDLKRRFSFGTRDQVDHSRSTLIKGTEKASDIDIRRGMENAPLTSLRKGAIYFLNYYNKFIIVVITINQKNSSRL